ncbi:MAG: hypothetical protein E7441_05470 [Ruminococcaceae bacterium]|nr:hypothetical protein [Oscillospiraceae bacterium]
MDFRKIPTSSQPAYTWLWNSTITREGIKKQIDEMYDNGIRAFYVLGEPENFRPTLRRTHLSPEYLSDEYLHLVRYAYEYAKEKGMYTWLYNEGGFPSGMACGKIRDKFPHLAMKELIKTTAGEYMIEDTCGALDRIRTDIAKRETTDEFIHTTHEAYKRVFGGALGSDITMMFDDEAYMGRWTDGLDEMFEQKYGYSMVPYLPYISGDKTPITERESRAVSDYTMLCGELVRDNYFIPMKQWLNKHNMLSTGHLDLDNQTDGGKVRRYGNVMATMRAFDAPGVDVIWSQITYPKDGKCCFEGNEFWVRCASSAARQHGKSLCISESFAVYGSHITPEEMRFVVNFQAVRGISRFNFMVVSYDRESAMACQYRPNFIKENPGMDMLSEINDYTARISHILESGKAEVKTALYCPYRSISGGGDIGKAAASEYEKLGHMLEHAGVDFDIIDEDFVRTACVKDDVLCGEFIKYKNVFVPSGALEDAIVTEKLSAIPSEIVPCIKRENPALLSRKVSFEDGTYAYLICNTSNDTIEEKISFAANGNVYKVDLEDGSFVCTGVETKNGEVCVSVSLLRGEMAVFYVSGKKENAKQEAECTYLSEIIDMTARVVREFGFGEKGILNTVYENGKNIPVFHLWDEGFSGEVEYKTILNNITSENILLDLGDVRHFARIHVNGETVAEKTMPPYRVELHGVKSGDELKILVANTAANVCARTDYFSRQDIADVGPYHEKLVVVEEKATAGGLLGPVKLYMKNEKTKGEQRK